MQDAATRERIGHKYQGLSPLMNERMRRQWAAAESLKVGPGGDVLLSQITGLNVATIRRGREELQGDLEGRPADQVRLPGGGRWPVEKKTPLC